MSDSLALVVLSTDNFSDIWPVFFSNFQRHWPGFSGKKYLIADTKSCDEKDVITLHPGLNEFKGKMDWGGRLLSCLPRIEENDLLIFLEDFILVKSVNETGFNKALQFFINNEIHFLTLGSHDLNRHGYFDLKNDFCRVKRFTKYRMTTSPGLWKKEILKTYLVKGLNPWQFEILGTFISMLRFEKFYMLNKNKYNLNYEILPYYIENGLDSAIVRGKWQRGILNYVDPVFFESIYKRGFSSPSDISRSGTIKMVMKNPFFVLYYLLKVLLR
ncbi:MAG: hypothetical protein MUC93_11135 [Bacteroidales bacterium]|jgi:hypothetical protein|nr:hypothetical protein [Bacteroidales bacterium]